MIDSEILFYNSKMILEETIEKDSGENKLNQLEDSMNNQVEFR